MVELAAMADAMAALSRDTRRRIRQRQIAGEEVQVMSAAFQVMGRVHGRWLLLVEVGRDFTALGSLDSGSRPE